MNEVVISSSLSAAKRELVLLYEQEGLSVEDIAAETGLEPALVKMALSESSHKFRTKDRAEEIIEEVWSEDDFKMVLRSMADIAISSDNHMARVKAGIYIIEEKTKRNQDKVDKAKDNRVSGLVGMNMNVLQLQARMLKAQKMLEESRAGKALSANEENRKEINV